MKHEWPARDAVNERLGSFASLPEIYTTPEASDPLPLLCSFVPRPWPFLRNPNLVPPP